MHPISISYNTIPNYFSEQINSSTAAKITAIALVIIFAIVVISELYNNYRSFTLFSNIFPGDPADIPTYDPLVDPEDPLIDPEEPKFQEPSQNPLSTRSKQPVKNIFSTIEEAEPIVEVAEAGSTQAVWNSVSIANPKKIVLHPTCANQPNNEWIQNFTLSFNAEARGHEAKPLFAANLIKLKEALTSEQEQSDTVHVQMNTPSGGRIEPYLISFSSSETNTIHIQPYYNSLGLESQLNSPSNQKKLSIAFGEGGSILSVSVFSHGEEKPVDGQIPGVYSYHITALQKILIQNRKKAGSMTTTPGTAKAIPPILSKKELLQRAIDSGGVTPFALIPNPGAILLPENLVIIKNALINFEPDNPTEIFIEGSSYQIWGQPTGPRKHSYSVITIQENAAKMHETDYAKLKIALTEEGKIIYLTVNHGSVGYLSDGSLDIVRRKSKIYYAGSPSDDLAISTIMSYKAPLLAAGIQEIFQESSVSHYSTDYGTVSVSVVPNVLQAIPNWHLDQFIGALFNNTDIRRSPTTFINFMKNNLTPGEEFDASGPSQAYLDLLYRALSDQRDHFFGVGADQSGLKMPVLKGPIKKEDVRLFENIGKGFAYCFLSSYNNKSFNTGQYFHHALFAALSSLKESAVKADILSDKQILALYTLLNKQYQLDGEKDPLFDAIIAYRNGWEDTSSTGREVQNSYREFLLKEALEIDAEAFPSEWTIETDDGERTINLEMIDSLPIDQHVEQSLFLFKFNQKTLQASPLYGKTIKPIHHIAKGILAFLNKRGLNWTYFTKQSDVNQRIQGVVGREAVIKALSYTGGSTLFNKKVEWLTLWIKTTKEENIMAFLVFVTASRSLKVGKHITLNEIYSNSLPVAHTCSSTLDISGLADNKITGTDETSRIAFEKSIEHAIAQIGFSIH